MLHMNYGANAMPSALCPKVSVPQCPDEGTDGGHHRFFLEFLTGFLPVETGRQWWSDACRLSL